MKPNLGFFDSAERHARLKSGIGHSSATSLSLTNRTHMYTRKKAKMAELRRALRCAAGHDLSSADRIEVRRRRADRTTLRPDRRERSRPAVRNCPEKVGAAERVGAERVRAGSR